MPRALSMLILLAACKPEAPPRLPVLPDSPTRETLPDPTLDWLVEARPAAGAQLGRTELLREFNDRWRHDHDVVRLYGWTPGGVVLVPDDKSPSYERVAVAIRLVTAAGDDDLRLVGAPQLERFRDEVTPHLRAAGAADVTTPRSAEAGAADGKKLMTLFMATGTEIQLRVVAPDGKQFAGKRVAELLGNFGLTPDANGHIEIDGFTVLTRTPPGRLDLPPLVAGQLNPNNLVFELYVPHVDRPVERFAIMERAAGQAARALGGQVEARLETFGRARQGTVDEARGQVAEAARKLEAGGFPAGAPSTRRLFAMP